MQMDDSIPHRELPLLFRHAWILLLGGTWLQGWFWWQRAQKHIVRDPSLEIGYRRLIRTYTVMSCLPWLVMGAGILSGSVPSVFHFFNPRNGPFVMAFYVCMVLLWIATFDWVFFRGGAEMLIRHPGLINVEIRCPWVIKLYIIACMAGGAVGLGVMLFGNLPTP